MKLKGKVALVMGSSRGIGKRTALHLAMDGADIVVTARTEQAADTPFPGTIHQTAEEVRRLGRRALAVRGDLAVREDVENVCRQALAAFARVDILIISAFYSGPGTSAPSPPSPWSNGTPSWLWT